ncbi:MAG: prolipoprotein diacylglyceryl transferase [Desulfatibacillaceae bacterium]
MYPTLIKFGPVAIRSYGLLIAMGVLLAMMIVVRLARREGIDSERLLDMGFWGVLVGLVTSRIGYVLVEWEAFSGRPLAIFRLWEGGLVFYWGLIGGVAVFLYYIRRHRLPFWKTLDIGVVGVALAHGFGRLGCLMAGCCFGEACELPWAVVFEHPESLAPTGIPLHPTQLYAALHNFAIFGILYVFFARRKFDGQILGMYFVLYAAARFTVEFFRGDERGAYLFGVLSPAQGIGVVMLLMGVTVLIVGYRRSRSRPGD